MVNETDRRNFLGASEAGSVLGLSKYKTPLALWMEKKGMVPPSPPSIPARAGNALEELVISLFEEKTGLSVEDRQKEFLSPSHPYLACHVDGLVDEPAIVEAKTTGGPEGWGEDGSSDVPFVYIAQTAVQMHLSGFDLAYIPVLIGRSDFRIYRIERDLELEALIIPRLVEFWEKNVLGGIQPDPVSEDDIRTLFPKSKENAIEADERIENLYRDLLETKKALSVLEERKDFQETAIKLFMAENDTLVDRNGNKLCTWKSGDRKGYTVAPTVVRTLRMSSKKEK